MALSIKMRPWLIGLTAAAIVMITAYALEMSRYASGIEDDEQVTRWLQRAQIMQQASVNKNSTGSRNVFVNAAAVKRAAIKKKARKKKKKARAQIFMRSETVTFL